MKQNFIITGINRVILVGKNEYPQNRIVFKQPTLSNELIYHFDGKAKVYFNDKVLETEENTKTHSEKTRSCLWSEDFRRIN